VSLHLPNNIIVSRNVLCNGGGHQKRRNFTYILIEGPGEPTTFQS